MKILANMEPVVQGDTISRGAKYRREIPSRYNCFVFRPAP